MTRKLFALLLTASVLLLLLTGCGGEAVLSEDKSSAYYDPGSDYTAAVAEGGLSAPNQNSTSTMPANQKLIRTVRLEAETEAMDALLGDVEGRVAQLGGYIENRNIYNGKTTYRESRWAELTIRVPADKLDQFVTQVSDLSNITSHNEETKDVTLSYVATESRITALKTEETRLLELMAEAKDLSDLLILEERLTDIRTELENHTAQIKLYDNQIQYATIRLSIREVVKYTEVEEPEEEPTFWQMLWNGFLGGLKTSWAILKGLVIVIVSAIPYLILPGIIVGVIFLIRHLRRRKAQKKDEPKPE